MSTTTRSTDQNPEAGLQRALYRHLREQAQQQQRQRQQKIERLVQQHGQRSLKAFRHPSR